MPVATSMVPADVATDDASKDQPKKPVGEELAKNTEAAMKEINRAVGEWCRKQRHFDTIRTKSERNPNSKGSGLEKKLIAGIDGGKTIDAKLRNLEMTVKTGGKLTQIELNDITAACKNLFLNIKAVQKVATAVDGVLAV